MSETPDQPRLLRALDATWPAAETRRLGPWTLRRGLGGGKRVSAASTDSPVTAADVTRAEAAMREFGQAPLFMLHEGNGALDSMLEAHGYRIVDPVLMFVAPVDLPAGVETVPLNAIPSEEPLAMMAELWARGGIGPARLAVMARARGPKTHLFSRFRDSPAGCAFVALDGDVAMLHALEVAPEFRRDGVARRIIGRAALWAREQGANWLATVTTGENLPAQGLFSGIGMQVAGKYHYRMK